MTLKALLEKAGDGPGTLFVSTTIRVDESLSIPERLAVHVAPGGLLSLAAGARLEILGPFHADAFRIVEGEGSLAFGPASTHEAFPEWWGDATSREIEKAVRALAGGTVRLRGDYRVVSPIPLKSGVWIEGPPRLSTLDVRHPVAFRQEPGSVIERCGLKNVRFVTETHPEATLLSLGTLQNSAFEDLSIGDFPQGTAVRIAADCSTGRSRAACTTHNRFERIETGAIRVGFDIMGCETSWVTANSFRDITLGAVLGFGFVFREYCDHDRFFNLTIRLAADHATGMVFNAGPRPEEFSFVYMQYFFGVTLITNVKTAREQVGLLFNNTRGHLFFGLSFGSSVWRGTRILDHGGEAGAGANSYFAIGTVSWDQESLSYWRKGARTDRSGSVVIQAGRQSTEVRHGLDAPPSRVVLTPTSDTGGRSWWVSKKEESVFVVALDRPADRAVSFDWKAQVDEG